MKPTPLEEDAFLREVAHVSERQLPATRKDGSTAEASGAPGAEPRPEEGELAPGARLGRYVILKHLGHGGMGVVYLAFDGELERRVAMKVLRAEAYGE
jgi:serine/threonine protein kinase